MPTKCAFVLSRTAPIYYNGEQISGRVCVNTSKRLVLTAIKLKLLGAAHVEWTERYKLPHAIEHNDCTEAESHSVCYRGAEIYLKECRDLSANITLETSGSFEQSFVFTLPESCVATCKQSLGEVAYHLQLELKREATFNKIFQHRIVVRNRVDLNALPAHVTDLYSIKSEGRLVVVLPCRGFVPGQLLHYRLASKDYALPARKINVALHELCQYRAVEPTLTTKEVSRVLAAQKIDKPHLVALRVDGCLRLPLHSLTSTMRDDCLLRISYYLAVVVTGARGRILEKLFVPITVGSTAVQRVASLLELSVERQRDQLMHCYDNLVAQQNDALPPTSRETLISEDSLSNASARFCDSLTLIPTH